MSLTKAQREARAKNETVLARNFPQLDAKQVTTLQNKLFALALKCERNAMNLCNVADYQDQREALRLELGLIAHKFGIELVADVTGDPRGACLKLHLPDQSHNTWGGVESGYAICSN